MGTPRAPDALFEMGLPVLGICYGQQTMVEQLGGSVEPHNQREFGRALVSVTVDARFSTVPGSKDPRNKSG